MLKDESKLIEKISKIGDLYQLKIGEMCVEFVYSENNKSFYDCMLNILKEKIN